MSRLGCFALALVALVALAASAAGETVKRDVAYVDDPKDARAQTLDLYLPEADSPPLLVFVHSHFWSDSSAGRALDATFARPLQGYGAAVAVVRHRPAPKYRHPAQAEDVAAALAFLVRNAARFGYDPARIFLAGHSSGAHLAALVALDPRYLAAHDMSPSVLAGVVTLSGVYDLDPGDGASEEELELYRSAFGGGKQRRKASPVRLARADAPPFLVITAANDIPGYAEGASRFVEALRRSGHPSADAYVVLERDHLTILDMVDSERGVPLYLLDFIGLRGLPPKLAVLEESNRYWTNPRFSTEGFWKLGARVRSFPADERFLGETRRLFQGQRRKQAEWRPERFHAIDLFELLEALGPERAGRGPWLTLTNVQMEKTYLELDELRKYRPVVVVGVDDEHNLFRVVDMHWAEREYSWRDDLPRPDPSARPMGAFLHFLEPPPKPVHPPTFGHFSLVEKSFARTQEDPLAAIRDLPPDLFEAITLKNGCLNCHRFRGIGSNAGHLRAVDASFHGGFALPLTKYPPEVWHRFVFQQKEVAAVVGTTPNEVAEPAAQKLYELVEQERAKALAAEAAVKDEAAAGEP